MNKNYAGILAKDGASSWKSIFAQFLTMREKQTLVWATGIQEENWGHRGIFQR